MKISSAIGIAFILLVVSGITLHFGGLTLDKLDSGQWGMVVLGAAVTILVFTVLVVCVKAIGRKDDHDEGD